MNTHKATNNWKAILIQKIRDCLQNPNSDIEKLWDILWHYGINKRIAPCDVAVVQERKQQGRAVSELGREDYRYYLRMLYSAGYTIEKIKMGISREPASFIYGALLGFQVAFEENPGPPWLWKFIREAEDSPIAIAVSKAMMEIARTELMERDYFEHYPILPISCTDGHILIEGYRPEGYVVIRVLGGNADVVCPSTLNYQSFQ